MNKLITVFDNYEPLNNVISALTFKVDEVFLLYHHKKEEKFFRNITSVLKKYGIENIHFVHLTDDDKQINNIIKKNKDIIFDVGGAKYLSLVLFEKALGMKNKIIYFDDEENVIKDYRTHTVLRNKVFKLTIEDVLQLKGGKIKSQMHKTYSDKRTNDTIVKLVENNIDEYPSLIRYISKLNSLLNSSSYRGRRSYVLDKNKLYNIKTDKGYRMIGDLFKIENNILTFKTEALRQLICISGAILENYLYIKLRESKKFDGVEMSTVIDFSEDKYKHPVRCELDCIVIKDNCMLMISCKSSKAETEDLNEIYVHNNRFGNALSKAVLCVGEEIDRKYPSIYAKAEELSVFIVDESSIKKGVANTFLQIFDGTYSYDEL